MEQFGDYIRGIAYFIMFTSFLNIILPSEKFRPYISFVNGLVMIIIVITPVLSFINGNSAESLIGQIQFDINRGVIEREKGYYSDIRLEMVMSAYKEELIEQMEHRLNEIGYTVLESECDISEKEEDFGSITRLYLEVSKLTEKESNGDNSKFITVDKIKIDPVNKENNQNDIDNSETDEIKMIKKYISDFYNLSVDNINILEIRD